MTFSRISPLHIEFYTMLSGLAGKIGEMDGKPYVLGGKRRDSDEMGLDYYPRLPEEEGKAPDETCPFVISGTQHGDRKVGGRVVVEIRAAVQDKYKEVVRQHLRRFAGEHREYTFEIKLNR